MLAQNDTVIASTNCVECELGSGWVVLDLDRNAYFRLNSVGMFVWRQLTAAPDRGLSAEELRERMLQAFDVEEKRCRDDLAALLERLASERLVRIVPPGGAARGETREAEHAHSRSS